MARAPQTNTWEEEVGVVGIPILAFLQEDANQPGTLVVATSESSATHYRVKRTHANGTPYSSIQPWSAESRVIRIGGIAYLVTAAADETPFHYDGGYLSKRTDGVYEVSENKARSGSDQAVFELDGNGWWRVGDGTGATVGYIGLSVDQADDSLRIFQEA